jgi:hypothetical protein
MVDRAEQAREYTAYPWRDPEGACFGGRASDMESVSQSTAKCRCA